MLNDYCPCHEYDKTVRKIFRIDEISSFYDIYIYIIYTFYSQFRVMVYNSLAGKIGEAQHYVRVLIEKVRKQSSNEMNLNKKVKRIWHW